MSAPTNRWEGPAPSATETNTVLVPDAVPGAVLFSISVVASTGITVPGTANPGWTQLYFVQEGAERFYVHWKIADGGGDDYITSWTGIAENLHEVVEFDGFTTIESVGAVSGTITSGVTMPMSAITPVVDTGTVVAFMGARRQNEWGIADGAGDVADISIDSSYVLDFARGSIGNTISPPIAGAHIDFSTIAPLSAAWNSADIGGIAAYYSVVLVPGAAVSGPWTATDASVALDAVGMSGQPNTASTVTFNEIDGQVVATDPVVVASANQTTRWFLKRKTGTGAIEITLDGSTWQATPALNTSTFLEVLSEQNVANPTIGIRGKVAGDEVIVGNAELYIDTPASEVAGTPPIITADEPLLAFEATGVEQTGVWTPDAAVVNVPNNSRLYPMNEGSGATLEDTRGDGTTDATIQNPGSAGGGWS